MEDVFHERICKVCHRSVGQHSGVPCRGACRAWVHFTCLQLSKANVSIAENGTLVIRCPCSDCKDPHADSDLELHYLDIDTEFPVQFEDNKYKNKKTQWPSTKTRNPQPAVEARSVEHLVSTSTQANKTTSYERLHTENFTSSDAALDDAYTRKPSDHTVNGFGSRPFRCCRVHTSSIKRNKQCDTCCLSSDDSDGSNADIDRLYQRLDLMTRDMNSAMGGIRELMGNRPVENKPKIKEELIGDRPIENKPKVKCECRPAKR